MRGVMAGGKNSLWDAVKISALVFAALIFFIVFLALYVNAVIEDAREVPAAQTEQNLQAHGRLHPREPQ